MTVFAAIRQKRRSGFVLSVLAFAWVNTLVASCAMAFDVGSHAHGTQFALVGSKPDHCRTTEQIPPAAVKDCCCNVPSAVQSVGSQPQDPGKFLALPISPVALHLVASNPVALHFDPPDHRASSADIYLTTLRLRI